ncbi:C-type lectin domain family 4 member C [Tupaia chinensis]|uniref:C-type lectin domain family 4 member C n=1 Tax=Tupaia chinensis TaxID=246437 RepID=L9KXF5_TUPCH|nr:C-type lectin domain family 4 member C [Tupaia chinensis]
MAFKDTGKTPVKPEVATHRIRMTLTSHNLKSLEKVCADLEVQRKRISRGTNNTLVDQDQDQDPNITGHSRLMLPDCDLLKDAESKIQPDSQQSDFLDVLIVSMDLIQLAHRASTLCGKIDKRLSTLQEYQDRHLNLSCFIEGKETEEDWSCCPALWRPFQSHCYFISPEMQPWKESQKNCSGMGADLMAINSKDEQTIHEKMNDCGTRTKAIAFTAHTAGIGMTSEPDSLTSGTVLLTRRRGRSTRRCIRLFRPEFPGQEFIIKHLMKESAYYVGLSDPAGQRRWQWVDQTPYDAAVTFWHPGEPNNRDERCVTIHFRTSSNQWGWNDVHCDLLQKSVCKMTKIYL